MHRDYDVAVVGGGLLGSAIAWGLGRLGKTVAVLDEGDIAKRASLELRAGLGAEQGTRHASLYRVDHARFEDVERARRRTERANRP